MKTSVVFWIGRILRKEVAILCSDKVKSVLKDKSNSALKTFQWKNLDDEMIAHTPILRSCSKVSRTSGQPHKEN